MHKAIRTVAVMVGLTLASVGVHAQELSPEQAAKVTQTRQAVLKVVGWNVGPMGGMVRGLIDWDQEAFALRARRVAWMTTMIGDAFRPDTSSFDVTTEALPVIWEDFAEFEMLFANVEASSSKLAAVAEAGDEAATKAAFAAMVDDCRACHDRFRVKRD